VNESQPAVVLRQRQLAIPVAPISCQWQIFVVLRIGGPYQF
jgi:hypothetical protein